MGGVGISFSALLIWLLTPRALLCSRWLRAGWARTTNGAPDVVNSKVIYWSSNPKVHAGGFYMVLMALMASMAAMDASWYLNHADEPKHVNMEPYRATTSDGLTTQAASRDFGGYRTSKAVKAGEELLLDYTRVLPSVYAHGVLAQQQPGIAAAARDR